MRRGRVHIGHGVGDNATMSTEPPSATRTVRRLVGVYNADGTALGELAYFIGAHLGSAHCGLCDITHGLVRPKPEWTTYRTQLPVPFDTYHRNDQPDALRTLDAPLPIVAGETDDGFVVLLGAQELDDCGGSIDQFIETLTRAIGHANLVWRS
jgi:hypothetical protein